jgi:hypothetical protein
MKRLLLLASVAYAAFALAPESVDARSYKIKGEVRPQSGGYRHVVIIKNKSRDWLSCEVWTDLDPTPHQSARLGPKTSREVIIRTMATEDEFTPFGFCRNNY